MITLIIFSIFVSLSLASGILLYRLLNRGGALKSRLAELMPQKREPDELIHTSKKWQLHLAEMGKKMHVKPSDMQTILSDFDAKAAREFGR